MQDTIEIKQLGHEFFDQSLELSEFAFQLKKSAEQKERLRAMSLEEPADRWAIFANDQLAAQVTVLDLQTYVAGKVFSMGGVANVATWPEYRRRGYVAKLLVHAIQEMKKKGQLLSFLSPFSFSFYRKFGWETYTEHKLYTIETKQLPPRSPYAGQMVREVDYAPLHSIYERYAVQYNGALQRSEHWWKYRIPQRKPGSVVTYRNSDGDKQGYLIYEVRDRMMTVHELIYLKEEARRALWSFIAQHDSMIDRVQFRAPVDDLLADTLGDPRIKQEIVPHFMARIVDAEAFISSYPFLQGKQVQCMIELHDEYAPWNTGKYEWSIDEEGNGTLSRLSDEETMRTEGIALDIGALSAWLMGYRSGRQLSGYQRIQGDLEAINRLQNRIPEHKTYLSDFF
ncbi:GNAT family N-acetyltransferase [Paenibacillus sp. J5C_2022]|uniref:GNAT family N-acetyltransferase n=1 Tax=Paenibacillus sp. J5C2022 TaxID=2977129 RepID=UPI0021D262C8|nr:GNAT family N-acetyltransferase [Paenibacillus sp. J5C2022]MCU6712972.1 GNAT family N-acetyltransferase [Paenibacillus sp. J5C2022]